MPLIKDPMLEWAARDLTKALANGHPCDWTGDPLAGDLLSQIGTIYHIVGENNLWDVACSPWGLEAMIGVIASEGYVADTNRPSRQSYPMIDAWWRVGLAAGIPTGRGRKKYETGVPYTEPSSTNTPGIGPRRRSRSSVARQVAIMSTRALEIMTKKPTSLRYDIRLLGALALRAPGTHREAAKAALAQWVLPIRPGITVQKKSNSSPPLLDLRLASRTFARVAGLRVDPNDTDAREDLEKLLSTATWHSLDTLDDSLSVFGYHLMPPIETPEAWVKGWPEAAQRKFGEYIGPRFAINFLAHTVPGLLATEGRQWPIAVAQICDIREEIPEALGTWIARDPQTADAVIRDWMANEPALAKALPRPLAPEALPALIESLATHIRGGGLGRLSLSPETLSLLTSSSNGSVRQTAWLLAAHVEEAQETQEPPAIKRPEIQTPVRATQV